MAFIHAEFEIKKNTYIDYFDEAIKKGQKFSITLDEWVNSRQH